MSEWQLQDIVEEYVSQTTDPLISQYEREVNFPDLVKMIPKDTKSLLDFGCGSGDFTKELSTKVSRVVGADMPLMCKIAQARHPDLTFFEWDGTDRLPERVGTFDAIFSKLTVQFVKDLDVLAVNFFEALNTGGTLIVSVPNPEYIAKKYSLESEVIVQYSDKVGGTDIEIHPLYRPKKVYIEIFERAGFMISDLSEPITLQDRGQSPQSKRLNLKFIKEY